MPDPSDPLDASLTPIFTGRSLLTFRGHARAEAVVDALRTFGLTVATTSGAGPTVVSGEASPPNAVYLSRFGIVILDRPPAQAMQVAEAGQLPEVIVEPERYVFASAIIDDAFDPCSGRSDDYRLGFRHGVQSAIWKLNLPVTRKWVDGTHTWGLNATNAATSKWTGRGVRVAVLDSGFDPCHPDFAGRKIVTKSFIKGESAKDQRGHGTLCTGIACGPRTAKGVPGYGIASEAEIYAGKVIDQAGSGNDGSLLQGIQWAVAQGCSVISISLGAPASEVHVEAMEKAARIAEASGTLLVAAAGNETYRPYRVATVQHPANCPSIMAVGAIDPSGDRWAFSNLSGSARGAEIDLAGPGMDVMSSGLPPVLHIRRDGTSVATPHVAGIAALYRQAFPAISVADLRKLLTRNVTALPGSASEVGAGLVQIT